MTDGAAPVVAEDDADIRTLLAGSLLGEGFRLDGGEGGVAFDALLTRGPAPALVVVDRTMPGEDELSICRRRRAADGAGITAETVRR